MSDKGYPTWYNNSNLINHVSGLNYFIKKAIANLNTAKLVKVMTCSNSGGVSAVGYVSVKILVHQVDAENTAYPHGEMIHVPYFRIQGGANAIIIDPTAGDIGICVFSDRDISAIKDSKSESPPNTSRMLDISDGLYIGGFLNNTPSQYVQFSSSGVTIHSSNSITLSAPTINLNGNISQGAGSAGSNASMIGPLTITNNATISGISIKDHVHSGVTAGNDKTGAPK